MTTLERVGELQPWLSQMYRTLHQIPELDRQLPETLSVLNTALDKMGIEHRSCAGGVVAVLGSDLPGPGIAVRADMDALPVSEDSGAVCPSKHPGKMHACGHDAHTTISLGVLKLLKDFDLPGPLAVLFQPAEETGGGAALMIAAGALDCPKIGAGLCLHVSPKFTTGSFGVMSGMSAAASDMFNIVLHGKGCHGAHPDAGIDTIAIGAQIVTALQQIISRNTSPTDSAVITIGHFVSGTARNVIPETTLMEGILRTLLPATRAAHRERIRRTAVGIAEAMGATAEVKFMEGYPALYNDLAMTDMVRHVGTDLLGAEKVITEDAPSMGVDDFAYIAEKVPGCYFDLGCSASDNTLRASLHSPKFLLDEKCLSIGVAVMSECALTWLRRRKS